MLIRQSYINSNQEGKQDAKSGKDTQQEWLHKLKYLYYGTGRVPVKKNRAELCVPSWQVSLVHVHHPRSSERTVAVGSMGEVTFMFYWYFCTLLCYINCFPQHLSVMQLTDKKGKKEMRKGKRDGKKGKQKGNQQEPEARWQVPRRAAWCGETRARCPQIQALVLLLNVGNLNSLSFSLLMC